MGGGHRLLERNADETLRGKIVDFVGLRLLQDSHTGAGVGQIVFDQVKVGVFLDPEFFQPPKVDRTGATVGAVNPVTFGQQQFGEVGAILAGDAGDECGFCHKRTP